MRDIDHFKRINDTWGQDAGDLVLKAMAEALTACLRIRDVAALLGGEEFAIILSRSRKGEVLGHDPKGFRSSRADPRPGRV